MTSNQESASLFEEGGEGKSDSIVFLTNRYNLLQILSASYIAPRESYSKYYVDLLTLGPGRIPLVRAPVSKELQALVLREGEASFPVALQLDADRVAEGKVPSLRTDGGNARSSLADKRAVAWAPSGAIPLSAVRGIIFQSNEDLAEHAARSYANISETVLPMVVDPSVFTGGTLSSETVTSWLQALPHDGSDASVYLRGDRIAGAKCLAAISLERAPDAAATVLHLLSPTARKRGGEPASVNEKPVAPWVALLTTGSPVRTTGGDLNTRLFAAAAKVFETTDRQAEWRPVEILGQIETIVQAKKLNKKDAGEILKNFESIRGILRNERDFKPFKPGSGLDVAKAILLVLMRPEADHLLEWPASETGADDSVTITAAVLCGLLNGREKLPIKSRPEQLDRFLAMSTASELSTGKDSVHLAGPLDGAELMVERVSNKGTPARVSLTWNGEALVTWDERPIGAKGLLANVDFGRPEAEGVALELCRRLSWNDCVRTQLTIETAEVSISAQGKGKTVIAFLGLPGSVTQKLDEKAFKKRLTSGEIPPEQEKELLSLLAKQTPQ